MFKPESLGRPHWFAQVGRESQSFRGQYPEKEINAAIEEIKAELAGNGPKLSDLGQQGPGAATFKINPDLAKDFSFGAADAKPSSKKDLSL